MKRFTIWITPLAVAACVCAFAAAGQQREHRPAPETAPQEQAPPPDPYTEAIRDNNLGIALMNRMDFENALGQFQAACILDPQSDAGCLNMGLALLYLHRYAQAKTILEKSAERDPQNPRAWFSLGLIEHIGGQTDRALDDFEKVRALEPGDPATAYFIGLIDSEAARDGSAIPNFERAINLDPFNASAELELSKARERGGDVDGTVKHLKRYQLLVGRNLGHTMTSTYGAQGEFSLAEELTVAPPVPPMTGAHFVDVTGISGLPAHFAAVSEDSRNGRGKKAGRNVAPFPAQENETELADFLGSGACVFDYDGDGKLDIFLVDGDGRGNGALYRNLGGGKFLNVTKTARLKFPRHGTGCATGDYNNDGRMDLAVSSGDGVRLFENEGGGKFKDVTEATGIHVDGLALGLTFVDYDRDGYLDLYVTRFNKFLLLRATEPFAFPTDAAPPGNLLWRNTGHGTFVDATNEAQVAGNAASVGAIASDVNDKGASDLIVTGWGEAPLVLLNQIEGPFQAADPWLGEMPGPTAGVVALDFDKDGWMDYAFTHWSSAGMSLWRNSKGLSFEKIALPDPGWMRGWGLCAFDYDNDGWVDLAALGETFAGEGRILLLRNEGEKGFRDVTHEAGLDKIKLRNPRSVIAADFDGDGNLDLLVTQNDAPPILLKNVGGAGNGWIDLGFQGAADNASGIGATVNVFAGDQRQKWEVQTAAGYLGGGPAEVHEGLGDFGAADVVRVLWPQGKQEYEMQVRGEKRAVISEDPGRSGIAPTGSFSPK